MFLALFDGCSPTPTPKGDVIDCTGTISGGAQGKGGNDTITVGSGAAMMANVADSNGTLIGSDGGNGKDTIINHAEIAVSSDGATATASGIAGANQDDTIQNNGTLDVTSTAENSRVGVAFVVGGNATTEAAGTATGIDGGAGKDQITNAGTLTVAAIRSSITARSA